MMVLAGRRAVRDLRGYAMHKLTFVQAPRWLLVSPVEQPSQPTP